MTPLHTTYTKRPIACAICALLAFAAHASGTYNVVTQLLSVDTVGTKGGKYNNVQATIHSYTLISVAGGAAGADSYDPDTQTLVLGSVAVQGSVYSNVTVRLNAFSLHSATIVPIDGRSTATDTAPTAAAIQTDPATQSPVSVSYRKPKVAAFDYAGVYDATRQAEDAKFDFLILGVYPSAADSRAEQALANMRALHSGIIIGNYTILSDLYDFHTPGDWLPEVQMCDQASWWLTDKTGAQVSWTNDGTEQVNFTKWAPLNSSGQSWVQWKAAFDTSAFYGKLQWDYAFVDNVFHIPRVDADWMRNGTNQPATDPAIGSETRQGYVRFFNELKRLNSGIKVIGNVDSDLSEPEWKGKLEGGFLEGQMGRNWSLETWAGWLPMYQRYTGAMANTASPHSVIFQVYSSTANNYSLMRYGLASAMLHDGYYAFNDDTTSHLQWFDEYDAPMGSPVDPPQTAPTASGIWKRTYRNGVVLVNPSTTSTLSIDIGPGYKHLLGTQDPAVNNGQAQQIVTLPPRSGVLMIKR